MFIQNIFWTLILEPKPTHFIWLKIVNKLLVQGLTKAHYAISVNNSLSSIRMCVKHTCTVNEMSKMENQCEYAYLYALNIFCLSSENETLNFV